jgi:hypothetical protein
VRGQSVTLAAAKSAYKPAPQPPMLGKFGRFMPTQFPRIGGGGGEFRAFCTHSTRLLRAVGRLARSHRRACRIRSL